ncbi:TonB-dependent receptor [Pedobacter miscanthi]|uniref:TonB-dependent receptor n=1 Tax=Pedobacter miscanthi TaxID=2259170 RepID=UPI0029305E0C|nr:TonB-dependent receptor [Pedobacter miscanthi]
MYRLKFLFLFLLFSATVYAQQGAQISGYITDSTGKVAGVSILIKNTKIGTTTDTDGFYNLKGLKAGNYTIVISYLGSVAGTKQANLKSGEQLQLDFKLDKNPQHLSTVAITAKTKSTALKESGFNVNGIETKLFLNTTTDLNQVLNRSTGVKVREQGGMGSDFNFSLNGLSGKQIRFFLDGIPMESFGSAMSLNNIPVNLAERIEVYKGVVPVELGADALGGAVNIITDQHTKKYLDASFSYGSFNTSRTAIAGRFTDEKTGLMFNFNGYHNYSDNDYLMRSNPQYDAAIKVVENGELVERDVRRFHNAYRATMGQFDVGLTHKSWADQITLGLVYSNLFKEIQTGTNQNKVYGALNNREQFLMPSVKYKKQNFLVNGLTANLMASYSINRSKVADTSSYLYSWSGKGRYEPIQGELNDIKSIYHYKNTTGIARANFAYGLDANNSLNLNYNYSHFGRSATEDLGVVKNNAFDVPNTISKNMLGFAFQNNLFNKKLNTTAFAKYYNFNAFVRNAVYFSKENSWVKSDSELSNNYFGYGLATRYKITEALGLKFSYEHAYRLQEGDELFGNGIDIASNVNLKPENSDNINLGAYYSFKINQHKFAIEGSYFFRNAKDFIYFIPTGGIFSNYTNLGKAQINGAEAEIRYNYSELFEFSVNATYQNAINKQEYELGTGLKDMTYGDRIPNQPWLYGNANFSIGKNDLLGKDTRLQLNLSTQYVNWFYLNWESRGSIESKNKIPSQLIHNVALSYSIKNGRYNISAESFNVTNELTYDNFRLQKPGRSFFMKLRYFIK